MAEREERGLSFELFIARYALLAVVPSRHGGSPSISAVRFAVRARARERAMRLYAGSIFGIAEVEPL